MKSTKYILLTIGLLGIAAAIYGLFSEEAFTNHIITLVCGLSLIYGFYELNKKDKNGV